MIYIKRILYLLLAALVYGIFTVLMLLSFLLAPIMLLVSYIITGKCVVIYEILIKFGEKCDKLLDEVKEKLSI